MKSALGACTTSVARARSKVASHCAIGLPRRPKWQCGPRRLLAASFSAKTVHFELPGQFHKSAKTRHIWMKASNTRPARFTRPLRAVLSPLAHAARKTRVLYTLKKSAGSLPWAAKRRFLNVEKGDTSALGARNVTLLRRLLRMLRRLRRLRRL